MTAALLDTSFLVRYLAGDPAEMADAAARVVDGPEQLAVSTVGMVEVAYVLSTVYRVPRQQLVDALVALLQKENIHAIGLDKALLVEAFLLCRSSGRVSFADAALWAEARSAGLQVIYTFDKAFPSEGMELRHGL